jgi:hypothetical protein
LIVLREPLPALVEHVLGRFVGGLGEDIRHHDCVFVDAVHETPLTALVRDAQLMAARADRRHRTGDGHRQRFASLKTSQQHSGLDAGLFGKRRSLDLAVEPDQRLIRPHNPQYMSFLTWFKKLGCPGDTGAYEERGRKHYCDCDLFRLQACPELRDADEELDERLARCVVTIKVHLGVARGAIYEEVVTNSIDCERKKWFGHQTKRADQVLVRADRPSSGFPDEGQELADDCVHVLVLVNVGVRDASVRLQVALAEARREPKPELCFDFADSVVGQGGAVA